MNRSDHLSIADSLQQSLRQWEQIAGDPSVAGEIIRGIIVHTVSALDPEHETQPPDRFGNPHPAPNTNRTFNAAADRIMRRAVYFGVAGGRRLPTAVRPDLLKAGYSTSVRLARGLASLRGRIFRIG